MAKWLVTTGRRVYLDNKPNAHAVPEILTIEADTFKVATEMNVNYGVIRDITFLDEQGKNVAFISGGTATVTIMKAAEESKKEAT